MLPWWIIFIVIAFVTAVFGFAGLATGAAGTAQVYFFIFIVISVLLIVARVRGRRRSSRIASNRATLNDPEFVWERRTPPGSRPGARPR